MQENVTKRHVIVIGAMADDRIAGGDTGMPWHLPEDLRRFKMLTVGHSVIMGRRTWETLKAPLPNRQNIVLSVHGDFDAQGATVAHSLIQGISYATLEDPIFVIGGRQAWSEALEIAEEVYLTRIYARFDGNVRFPELDDTRWCEVSREEHETETSGRRLRFDFISYRHQDRVI
jgi:dihydrofolate reductase